MFEINYLKHRGKKRKKEKKKNAQKSYKDPKKKVKKPLRGEKRFTGDKNGACSREHVCTTGVDPS